jgi:hypothetical protein
MDYVTFTLAGDEKDQAFELAKSAILENNDYGQELFDLLHSLLGWPEDYVTTIGVSVDDGEGNDDTPVNTLDELRQFMVDENPVFQLHIAGAGQLAGSGQVAVDPEPVSQRDYRTHSVFMLEELAAKLSCDGKDEAEHLFALIRRNHRHSKDFIQDLMVLFKPLRDRVDEQWDEVEELMTLCKKGVNMDADTALGFRAWIGHLSDQNEQEQARAYLSLVELKSPIMAHGIGELIKLFRPDDGFWTDLRSIKETFRTVDLDIAYD